MRTKTYFSLVALPIFVLVALTSVTLPQTEQKQDVWEPLQFLLGVWEGTGKGKPGIARVERDYQFVLGGTYMQVRNISTYAPQEKNPKGQRHEDWGMISFDKGRKRFVLRQFHIEGFVNQYVMDQVSEQEKTLLFQSESIENIGAGWRARETYTVISKDEFIEIFELAAPGKDFEVYTENHFRRKISS